MSNLVYKIQDPATELFYSGHHDTEFNKQFNKKGKAYTTKAHCTAALRCLAREWRRWNRKQLSWLATWQVVTFETRQIDLDTQTAQRIVNEITRR